MRRRDKLSLDFLNRLTDIIEERRISGNEGSYTKKLLEGGARKIAAKVIEEAHEVAAASLEESDKRLIEETADLIYHLLVLLASKDLTIEEVVAELEERHR